MDSCLKIGTWNLCLGLPNKKDIVTDYLKLNSVNVCCLQETDVPVNFPEIVLNTGGFNLELEQNDVKKRVGVYIHKDIKYKRRNDLESKNFHIVICDIITTRVTRIVCLYRSFKPPGMLSPDAFFNAQLAIIKNALNDNCIIMGDFNLDACMSHRPDYKYKIPLASLSELTLNHNLTQLVSFKTWSRTIKGIKKESMLDHVYVNNFATVANINYCVPAFGDHVLVLVDLNTRVEKSDKVITKRDWSCYSSTNLNIKLQSRLLSSDVNWASLNVCEYWNTLEDVIINCVDEIAPLKSFTLNGNKSGSLPRSVKNKINKRNRLLKSNNTTVNVPTIRNLNREIKDYFVSRKVSKVKKASRGHKTNIWKAVKVAKDLCPSDIPSNLSLGGISVPAGSFANSFANYFYSKVNYNVEKTQIQPSVYNGKCQLIVSNRHFMKYNDVKSSLFDLPNKKCEGFDRIPVCALYDARATLLDPFSLLFDKIYRTCTIPEQWKVSKIIPIFKKGSKINIENYRPIANLCSASKIFEKLILKQINYLESTNKLDLTGKNQHGFKRNRSTATAGALLQSIIARAADENNYVVMASLDLSMAFDLVNTELLIKRLKVMGLPNDLVNLIREWLTGRSYYVQVGEDCSVLFDSNTGTIQGSVLGPVLYALFVSPLFDLDDLINFADDNFCVEWNKNLPLLITNLEKRLEMITKWLKESGLVVNESKTEVCLFHKNDQPLIHITLQGVRVTSSKSMNVLGVTFDTKLNWQLHIANAIFKARKALFALRLLKRFFTNDEMRTLLDAHFYSVLYYNAAIWLTPSLSPDMKQNLLSISANALRSCLMHGSLDISFDRLHKTHKKCTPTQIMYYQMALNLFKIVNNTDHELSFESLTILDQVICTRRQIKFQVQRNFTSKIGLNTTANKLYHLNNLIGLDLLNLTLVHFKKLMKLQFLKYGKT